MTYRDKIEHIVVAAAFLAGGILLGHPEAGAAAGIAVFIGREHAAAVWNLQTNEGWGKPKPRIYAEIEALKFWKWRPDNLFDLVAPTVGNIAGYVAWTTLS